MKPWQPATKQYVIISLIALVVVNIIALGIPEPAYTDAYYYFNAGQRLATGEGLTDPYIALTYLNAPESLPAPAHTYWMPLTSLLVALAGGSFRAAQVIFSACWLALVLLAFWLGARLGGSPRHAWAAGLLMIFCGYFAPFLVTTDTFAPYGVFGAFCLLALGWGLTRQSWRWFALAGALAALAHLTRADGLLLLGVLGLLAVVPGRWLNGAHITQRPYWQCTLFNLGSGVLAYLLVMLPWFLRNMRLVGTPLPVGGTATIWLRGYNEIVSYPPAMNPANFLTWGLPNILQSRWEALLTNLGTFVAVEGLIVLAPLIIIALVKRWRHPLLLPVWIYAVLLHLAMTLAFAYPGLRGGLFHSAAALMPWWMALGIIGLDDVIDWIARRRRTWRPAQAKWIFTGAVIVLAILLTITMTRGRFGQRGGGTLTRLAADVLPADAVVMSNDPTAFYYHTGLPGLVVPQAGLDGVQALVTQYNLTHIVLDSNHTLPLAGLYNGTESADFLRLVEQNIDPTSRVFEVIPPGS
ncbi:hypothetical protein ACFLYO_05665 [Chloroflexota bacterium]